ncbi:hypothetical protein GCM10025865_08710 [Paraoerskovia sediminicola]|uniref:Uncharacterized protein n=1 Tax=Paraoerskovia sediminicola TaxID=1138587 RepID=A0ABM8G0H7_9CELL|nr:hypothetical protein GCM10025865_08710 [Paraoerskovia sediminicola]
MTDAYLDAVNSGFMKAVAKKLGLPQPVVLRRHEPGAPLVPGPVLVVGGRPDLSDDADQVAKALLAWDLDVRQVRGDAAAEGVDRWGAIVVVLSGAESPRTCTTRCSPWARTCAGSPRAVVSSRSRTPRPTATPPPWPPRATG